MNLCAYSHYVKTVQHARLLMKKLLMLSGNTSGTGVSSETAEFDNDNELLKVIKSKGNWESE